MRVRRLLAALVLVIIATTAAGQRIRKHVDDLTPPEIDALADAFQHLKDSNELVRWADIHGVQGDTSGCEHNSEQLWPWHRAYLIEFENALRASDPPTTSNVTIPYWDWTEVPSGSRYPKIFETIAALQGVTCDSSKDKCSPRVANCRNVCPNPAPPLSPGVIEDIQNIPTWRDYGGGLKGQGFKGQLESEAHDFIHGTYINGLNRNPVRAARDPLFWAHHSYMDKLWAEWQAAHKGPQFDPVCTQCPINFLPQKTVGDYLDIAKLGYSYAPKQTVAASSSLMRARSTAAAAAAPLTSLRFAQANHIVETPLPIGSGDDLERAVLVFYGVTLPTDASYTVQVYLRPAGAAGPRSGAEQLTMFSMWQSDAAHAGHLHSAAVRLDITRRLRELLHAHPKTSRWTLQMVILRTDDEGNTVPVKPGGVFHWESVDVESARMVPMTTR